MIINTLASLNSAMLQGMGIHFKILDKVGKTEAKKVNERERERGVERKEMGGDGKAEKDAPSALTFAEGWDEGSMKVVLPRDD